MVVISVVTFGSVRDDEKNDANVESLDLSKPDLVLPFKNAVQFEYVLDVNKVVSRLIILDVPDEKI